LFFSNLLARTRELPGVEAAAITDALPGGTAPAPQSGVSILQAADRPENFTGLPRKLDGSWISVSPEFLDTIGVKLRSGRGIQSTDVHGGPLVAVLSRSAADGLWPNEDPIGKVINCCRLLYKPVTVIGVADDPVSSSDVSPWTRHSNFVFLSAAQAANDERVIVVRAKNPAAQVDALRALIHSLNDRVPVFDAGPVDEFLLAGVAVERAQRVLTTSLGLLALGLAMFGVYGVVGYFVSRRTREFGLRLALGAVPRQILKMVVDYAIHIILIGLLPGVLLASLGTRLFEHQLFGIMPNGITMWIVAPVLMLAAGVGAGLIPAWRAARVDPNVTLRDL
jgi:ABC-type antimicrobial peptide transport system permease subunit